METKVLAIEAPARIIVTKYQDIKFIKSYSNEAIDEYLNDVKKKLENTEETRKYIIPPDAPVTIVYQIGRSTLNHFTTNMFPIYPKTDQVTPDRL